MEENIKNLTGASIAEKEEIIDFARWLETASQRLWSMGRDVPIMFAAIFLPVVFGVVPWHAMSRMSSIRVNDMVERQSKRKAKLRVVSIQLLKLPSARRLASSCADQEPIESGSLHSELTVAQSNSRVYAPLTESASVLPQKCRGSANS
jgi:hypothetical protein